MVLSTTARGIAREWGAGLRSMRLGQGGTQTRPAMTQKELARRLGVTPVTIHRWEHGDEPPLEFKLALSGVFNVPPAMLFPLPQVVVRPR